MPSTFVKIILAGFALFLVPNLGSAKTFSEIGIVGDSGITGAAADPSLALDVTPLASGIGGFLMGPVMQDELASQILGLKDPSRPHPNLKDLGQANAEFRLPSGLRPPLRVFFSAKEIDKDQKNIVDLNLSARGSMKIDLLQYSHPYFVGSYFGVTPENMFYVAQDGQRTDSIARQFDRFNTIPQIAKRGYLPELIVISFTANDFCSEEVLQKSPEVLALEYRRVLTNQLTEIRKKFRAHPLTTHLVLMAPLNVAQIFENQALLRRTVPFMGKTATCSALREHSEQLFDSPLRTKAFNGLLGMCPAVLKTKLGDQRRIEHFKAIFDNVIKVQTEVVAALSTETRDGWTYSHFKDSYDLRFDTLDSANDCFHPGLGAHIKLAKLMITHLKRH